MKNFLAVLLTILSLTFIVSLIMLLIKVFMKKDIRKVRIVTFSSLALFIICFFSFGAYSDSIKNKAAQSSDSNNQSNSSVQISTTEQTDSSTSSTATTNSTPSNQRQAQGKATDLGAGTFTVGKDIPEGLYDVTPADGQGNFIITNAKSMDLNVNSILGAANGMGVSKVRVKLVGDEQIKLESINKTHFEPVATQLVTDHKALSLYSGRFIVGEDIGKGRYVATPASGTGNFIIYDKSGVPKTNEILGGNGVKQVTVDLDNGDIITISALNQVDFATKN